MGLLRLCRGLTNFYSGLCTTYSLRGLNFTRFATPSQESQDESQSAGSRFRTLQATSRPTRRHPMPSLYKIFYPLVRMFRHSVVKFPVEKGREDYPVIVQAFNPMSLGLRWLLGEGKETWNPNIILQDPALHTEAPIQILNIPPTLKIEYSPVQALYCGEKFP